MFIFGQDFPFHDIFQEKFPKDCILLIGFIVVGYVTMLFYVFGVNGVSLDPLNKNIIRLPLLNWHYSFWPISHYIFYTFLGYHYPQFVFIFLIIGIIWEIIEFIAGKVIASFIKDHPHHTIANKIAKQFNKLKKIQYTVDAMGSFSDIIFNAFGLMTGYYMSRGYLTV